MPLLTVSDNRYDSSRKSDSKRAAKHARKPAQYFTCVRHKVVAQRVSTYTAYFRHLWIGLKDVFKVFQYIKL